MIARRVIERYFSCPNYYRIGGRPVFMIYDVDNLIAGLGGVEQTREALDWFRAENAPAGSTMRCLDCAAKENWIRI